MRAAYLITARALEPFAATYEPFLQKFTNSQFRHQKGLPATS